MIRIIPIFAIASLLLSCGTRELESDRLSLKLSYFDVCYRPIFESPFEGLDLERLRVRCVKLPRINSFDDGFGTLVSILEKREPGRFDSGRARVIIVTSEGVEILIDEYGGASVGGKMFSLGENAPKKLSAMLGPMLNKVQERAELEEGAAK